MAYSTALEEEEEAGWQCCMPPRGSFGVLSPSQGAAEGVRNRDNPPPQPRPVEAHLVTAMARSILFSIFSVHLSLGRRES